MEKGLLISNNYFFNIFVFIYKAMKYNILPYQLEFKFPFRLAHTVRDHTQNAYLEIKDDKYSAYGELVFLPYYPETLDTFRSFMQSIELPKDLLETDLKSYLKQIDHQIPGNMFAKAALDIALHNLLSKHQQTTISELYHITPKKKNTSFTIGISSNEELEQKIAFAENFSYIKLKVNEAEMSRIINLYRVNTDKPFVIDANQGFENKEAALEWCVELKKMGVAYFEQPFDKNDYASHAWLSERSPIPIIADESFQRLTDLDKAKKAFHGINVKLMKCGGLAEAYSCLSQATTQGLKTVLGCMSESSVAVKAAWNLAPLANWVDLDGPFLIKNDAYAQQLLKL